MTREMTDPFESATCMGCNTQWPALNKVHMPFKKIATIVGAKASNDEGLHSHGKGFRVGVQKVCSNTNEFFSCPV